VKAWKLSKPGGELKLVDAPIQQVRAGTVLVRMHAAPMLTYFDRWAAGQLPYTYPQRQFTPGTNGVGVIEAIGNGIYHFKPGDRVFVDPYMVAAENVAEPAQILTGLTGIGIDSGEMLNDWADGTYSEYVLTLPTVLTRLDRLDNLPSERLAYLSKFAVPFGGLLRGDLRPAQTLIVNGATGYFGSGAVLAGVALGARRVVALGRNRSVLDRLAALGRGRIACVALSGETNRDSEAIRDGAGGSADMALDMVGGAGDANATLAALSALRRGGRLVLMGSMTVPLPLPYAQVLANNWEIVGNFMYSKEAIRRLSALVESGALDLEAVALRTFPLADLKEASRAAAGISGLEAVCLVMER
jgi:alcohol dehydrogenase